MNALTISNLEKTYSNGVKAVTGISMDVKKGDFFALLGPNGAGKSTTIGILSSLVNKTSGDATVFNHEVGTEEAKQLIGLVPQEFNFNIFEKVFDIVVNQAGYYGIPLHIARPRAEKLLKQLNLWDKRDQKSMTLSGGMKRKLMIVRALIHEPKLLILDEPTAGVDVETRREMWDFLIELNKKGTTIILTTHYLEEAENLCKNIAIIDKGTLIENTRMKKLLSKIDTDIFVLDIEPTKTKLKEKNGYELKQVDDNTLEISIKKGQSINEIVNYLSEKKIKILSMRNKTNRLEELFIELTSHHRRDAK